MRAAWILVATLLGIAVAVFAGARWLARGRAPSASGPLRQDAPADAPTLEVRPRAAEGPPTEAEPAAPAHGRTYDVRVVVRLSGEAPAPAGVLVRACREDRPADVVRVGRTDGSGRVLLRGLADADHFVAARLDGHVPAYEYWGPDPQAPDAELVIELQRGTPVNGRVLAENGGAPVVGASVVQDDWPIAYELGPTDAAGAFRVPGIAAGGAAELLVRAPGFVARRLELFAQHGRVHPSPLEIRLRPACLLRGTVTSSDGLPVAGAEILVVPYRPPQLDARPLAHRMADWEHDDAPEDWDPALVHRARTDDLGRYRIDGLQAHRSWSVGARRAGHGGARVEPVRGSSAPGIVDVDLCLARAAGARVLLVPPEHEDLPRKARVRIVDARGHLFRPEGSSRPGIYRFWSLEAGPAHVYVEAAGYRPAARAVQLAADDVAVLQVRLDRGAGVQGRVLDAAGQPAYDVTVRAAPADRNPRVRYGGEHGFAGEQVTATDRFGRFLLTGLPPGGVLVAARENRGTDATRAPLRVEAPADGITLRLARKGDMRVRLLAADGHPFEGQARVAFSGGFISTGFISTGRKEDIEGGRIERHALRDGRYTLWISPEGHAHVTLRFEIAQGADVDLGEVRLERGVRYAGQVLDDRGEPAPDVSVAFEGTATRGTFTDADGRFVLEHGPGTGAGLVVTKDDVFVDLQVEPARTTDLEVTLPRAARLRGSVRRADGSPASEVEIELRPPGAKGHAYEFEDSSGATRTRTWYEGAETCETDDAGRLDRGLPPGRYVAWWEDAAGRAHELGTWTFAPGERHEVEIVLPDG